MGPVWAPRRNTQLQRLNLIDASTGLNGPETVKLQASGPFSVLDAKQRRREQEQEREAWIGPRKVDRGSARVRGKKIRGYRYRRRGKGKYHEQLILKWSINGRVIASVLCILIMMIPP